MKFYNIFKNVSDLQNKVDSLTAEIFNLKRKIRANKKFKVGDRVKVNNDSGFSKGSCGLVMEVLSSFDDLYDYEILRDNASSTVFYYAYELDKIT